MNETIEKIRLIRGSLNEERKIERAFIFEDVSSCYKYISNGCEFQHIWNFDDEILYKELLSEILL